MTLTELLQKRAETKDKIDALNWALLTSEWSIRILETGGQSEAHKKASKNHEMLRKMKEDLEAKEEVLALAWEAMKRGGV